MNGIKSCVFITVVSLASPCALIGDSAHDDILQNFDAFIIRQMDIFHSSGPRLVQSYAQNPELRYRGDMYDTAVAACYLIARGNLARARALMDAIVFLQENDKQPDSRTHAAYWANNLRDPSGSYTSIYDPDVAIGNMSWQGIALIRFYNATKEKKYLDAAKKTGIWILKNCRHKDGPGGFSGGLIGWSYSPATWRSTEHNIDVYVFAMCLYNATGDRKWEKMALHAKSFVQQMFQKEGGYYLTGTKADGISPNFSPIPADVQIWSVLSGIDATTHTNQAMQWFVKNLIIRENIGGESYVGVRFSSNGKHIHSEVTAGTAMAFWLTDWQTEADELFSSLGKTRTKAPNCAPEGIGIVATPWPEGAFTGFGTTTYVNSLHVASTAWTGLAILVKHGNESANPLRPVPKHRDEPKKGK